MGEAKAKRARHSDMLLGKPRCIYCTDIAASIEHMPPIAMFEGRRRPKGFEFPACLSCNGGSRAADAAAAFFARLSPHNRVPAIQRKEWQNLLSTLDQLEPQFRQEIVFRSKHEEIWIPIDSILQRRHKLELGGPVVTRLMNIFAAKLGMAFFAEKVGRPLGSNGFCYSSIFSMSACRRALKKFTYQYSQILGNLRRGNGHLKRTFNSIQIPMAIVSLHRLRIFIQIYIS